MRSRIQKWGNSLALRIPKSLADDVAVTRATLIDVSVENGALVIRPVTSPGPSLDHLLAGVTPDNLHREADIGPAVGDEAR